MKKILLGIGSLGIILVPSVLAISCGNNSGSNSEDLSGSLPTIPNDLNNGTSLTKDGKSNFVKGTTALYKEAHSFKNAYKNNSEVQQFFKKFEGWDILTSAETMISIPFSVFMDFNWKDLNTKYVRIRFPNNDKKRPNAGEINPFTGKDLPHATQAVQARFGVKNKKFVYQFKLIDPSQSQMYNGKAYHAYWSYGSEKLDKVTNPFTSKSLPMIRKDFERDQATPIEAFKQLRLLEKYLDENGVISLPLSEIKPISKGRVKYSGYVPETNDFEIANNPTTAEFESLFTKTWSLPSGRQEKFIEWI